MRSLVHLSDLHLGHTRRELLLSLRDEILNIAPDLIIVSGDLTYRAKASQFQAAHEFLQSLPFKKLVVPGVHDIPLWNFFLKFLDPLSRYRHAISSDLMPLYEDDEISVQGITTTDNRASEALRYEKIIQHWESLPPQVLRILVSHHPLGVLTSQRRQRRPRLRIELPADLALPEYADLLLSGHAYQGDVTPTERVMVTPDRSIIAIQAGSTPASRFKGELNSYNHLKLSRGEIQFEQRIWSEIQRRFQAEKSKRFFTRSGIHPFGSPEPAQIF